MERITSENCTSCSWYVNFEGQPHLQIIILKPLFIFSRVQISTIYCWLQSNNSWSGKYIYSHLPTQLIIILLAIGFLNLYSSMNYIFERLTFYTAIHPLQTLMKKLLSAACWKTCLRIIPMWLLNWLLVSKNAGNIFEYEIFLTVKINLSSI